MTKDGKPGSLLDTLRTQSDAMRSAGETARRPIEEAMADIDRRLWRAFRWLDEAVGHLQVIRPEVTHRFALGNILSIERPRFDRGFASYRRRAIGGQELLERIELFYQLDGRETIVLRLNPGGAAAVEERLRAAALPFQYQTEHDERRVVRYGVFTITPAISATVRVMPDYRRQLLEVTLRNVDRFESVALEFTPERLEEEALEDLVRLVLGQPSTFLRRAPLAGMRVRRDVPLETARLQTVAR